MIKFSRLPLFQFCIIFIFLCYFVIFFLSWPKKVVELDMKSGKLWRVIETTTSYGYSIGDLTRFTKQEIKYDEWEKIVENGVKKHKDYYEWDVKTEAVELLSTYKDNIYSGLLLSNSTNLIISNMIIYNGSVKIYGDGVTITHCYFYDAPLDIEYIPLLKTE